MHFRLTRRGPSLWNRLLTNEEKDMSHLSSLKMKMKKKLLDSENELSFFKDFVYKQTFYYFEVTILCKYSL